MSMDNTPKKLARWAKRSGWQIGSHVHHGMFIVSKPDSTGMLGPLSRQWAVAQVKRDVKGSRTVDISGGVSPLRNAAVARMQRLLAEKGISPKEGPTIRFENVPAYPVNALD